MREKKVWMISSPPAIGLHILKAIVINVSSKDRKIGLSVKTLEGDGEAGAAESYAGDSSASDSAPSTFGDLLKAAAESGSGSGDE